MAQCRICLEDVSLNALISPCLCNGTSRYVHRACLERWRRSSTRAFSKCSECNYVYKLETDYPMEKLTFNLYNRLDDMGRYLCSLLAVLVSSFYLRIMGKTEDYPSLTLLNLGLAYDEKNFIEVLSSDEINSGCYYFSLNNFIISFFSYISFFILISVKIKRQYLYWKLCKMHFILKSLSSYHFLWLYWLLGSSSASAFEFFIILDATLSLCNFATFISLLRDHDIFVKQMNTIHNRSYVLELPRGAIV